MNTFSLNDDLSHHGVKGQEWGVRNGPPYPLGSAGKKRNRVNAKYKKERSILESKKSTQEQKNKVSAGLGQMSGENRYITTYYHIPSDEGHTAKKKIGDVIEKMQDKIFDDDTITKYVNGKNGEELRTYDNHAYVSNFDLMLVNGEHRTVRDTGFSNVTVLETGYNQNCLKCSAALELRRRGMNVIAGGSDGGGNGTSALSYWFNNAVTYKESSSTVNERLSKFGRRASAEINFSYPNSAGGHSLYVQNDQSNNPVFYDGQTGYSFNSLGAVYSHYGFDRSAKVNITRLDNATPNFKHMTEDNVLELRRGLSYKKTLEDKRNGKVYDRW